MKTALRTLLFSVALLSATTTAAVAGADKELAPTGLTLVVCASTNKVVDTVVVPDDKSSLVIRFTVPQDTEQIRVFVVGHRFSFITSDIGEYYFIVRPDDEKWNGLGHITAKIKEGILTGIAAVKFDDVKTLALTKEMGNQIKADIAANKRAPITTVIKDGE